jgi:hypothetical protein
VTTFPVQGGCHCGAVRYTLLGPALGVQHCHCSRCRKVYGHLAAQGAVIARSQIRITGESNLTTYRSSPSFAGQFCKTCGCHLFSYEDSEKTLMYFSPATLDGGVHPGHPDGTEIHIQVGSKAEWARLDSELPRYDTSGPGEIITAAQKK